VIRAIEKGDLIYMSTATADTDVKPQFSESVQALINEGRIKVSEDDVKVGAEVSPNGEELKGSYLKLSGDLSAAMAYLDGDGDRAAAYLWDKINTVRKNSARQTLVNQAVPSEDKAILSMARKAIKGGVPGFVGLSDADAVAKLKAQLGA
jgi:hypothetical protein